MKPGPLKLSDDMRRSQTIKAKVRRAEEREARELATAYGLTMSDLIRMLLIDEIRRWPQWDAARGHFAYGLPPLATFRRLPDTLVPDDGKDA